MLFILPIRQCYKCSIYNSTGP